MEKLDMQSPNLVSKNIENIAALFPNCVTEGANGKVIDFDLLRQELSDEIVEGSKERYRLEWPGKREAIVTANLATNKTLRPIRADSVNFDTTENLYIEGDNLEVLKVLQESYLGKIKMIYIDPPYNTGKDFVYKDNFHKTAKEELFESGQTDEYNQRLIANPETAGRYHSDWLSMMYPRLKLARNLLTNDGVIFISIDDNEVHNLRKVCDDIFGETNFIGTICWKHTQQSKNDERFFSRQSNYNVVYSKHQEFTNRFKFNRTENDNKNYSNPDNDLKGDWRSGDVRSPNLRKTLKYDIKAPNGYFISPPLNGWRWSKESVLNKIATGEIIFKEDNSGIIRKIYLVNQEGRTPENLWEGKEFGTTRIANSELKELFGNKVPFDTPKPVNLVKKIIELLHKYNDLIVLDFFSGSATSAQSVLEYNSNDKGKRKYIQVQLPEETDEKSEAYKAGYKNICEIGKERIRRAGKKIVEGQTATIATKKAALEKTVNGELLINNGQFAFPKTVMEDETAENLLKELNDLQSALDNLDTGFRVYRLDSSNMADVYYKPQDYKQEELELFADNVKEDRTADDLLAQIMLDWGLPLSLNIERVTIEGKEVFKVAGNSLHACFDKDIDEDFAKSIAKEKPLRIVFKDSSFKDDTAKVNVKQLLKQLSSETEMRVI
jgi:adenine-specific DNA-methyltransferase